MRWCNSTRPRCFRFQGVPAQSCVKTLHEEHAANPAALQHALGDPAAWLWVFSSWHLLAAINCCPIWWSSRDKVSIISTETGKERAYNSNSSAYLIVVSCSWWTMATSWCPLPQGAFQSSVKSIGLRALNFVHPPHQTHVRFRKGGFPSILRKIGHAQLGHRPWSSPSLQTKLQQSFVRKQFQTIPVPHRIPLGCAGSLLDRVSLLLNSEQTVLITNEAQPPQTITTAAGSNSQSFARWC